MSWIKENKFIAGLAGGTLLGAIALLVVGSIGSGKYAAAKEKFETASAEAAGFERGALYPKGENKLSKSKALGEYQQAVESLQAVFEPFRPKDIKNITPQEFTDNLLASHTQIREVLKEAGTAVPEDFFAGFERYKTSLAPSAATGLLNYQLVAVKNLMLAMAKAKVGELKNFYRQPIPEEDGQVYTASADAVARAFPLELTFTGTEQAVREFLSSITRPDDKYLVIRTLRIGNVKSAPPRASDAVFDKPKDGNGANESGSSPFGGDFVLPGEDGAVAPAVAPKAADSSRILSQVLGLEQIQVFLRLDLFEFLPAKKLP